jgi:hypothetical protein
MPRKKPTLADAVLSAAAPEGAEAHVQCSINIPKSLHRKLRLAAVSRAEAHGGRPSVSAVISDYLGRHLNDIEAEARQAVL